MARLKERNTFPPGGFQWLESQTGWSAPKGQSFAIVVNKLIEQRKSNPFITQQHNLPTDYDSVADQVDVYNAERIRTNPAWMHFLSDATPGGGQWLPRRLSRTVGAVVEAVKRTSAGIAVLSKWLGQGLRPVDQALANKRAERCAQCPNNVDPNWLQKLDAVAAEDIRKLVGIKNDMKLETPYDGQLHTCGICDCYLRLKAWVPAKHISDEISTDMLNRLSAVSGKGCWVPEEVAALK